MGFDYLSLSADHLILHFSILSMTLEIIARALVPSDSIQAHFEFAPLDIPVQLVVGYFLEP